MSGDFGGSHTSYIQRLHRENNQHKSLLSTINSQIPIDHPDFHKLIDQLSLATTYINMVVRDLIVYEKIRLNKVIKDEQSSPKICEQCRSTISCIPK